jgi:hypothetical protein
MQHQCTARGARVVHPPCAPFAGSGPLGCGPQPARSPTAASCDAAVNVGDGPLLQPPDSRIGSISLRRDHRPEPASDHRWPRSTTIRAIALAISQLPRSKVLAIVPLVMRGPTTVFTHRELSPHPFTPMSGAHKRSAGQDGFAVLWHAGRAWPALPEHYLQLFRKPGNPCVYGVKSAG